jgi:hypothetical protein
MLEFGQGGSLAVACAEAGDFPGAVQYQKQALASPGYPGDEKDKGLWRLHRFEAGKPYRDE